MPAAVPALPHSSHLAAGQGQHPPAKSGLDPRSVELLPLLSSGLLTPGFVTLLSESSKSRLAGASGSPCG